MCIRHETREKARQSLAFSRVSKPHTHITHMLRQCTSIVYLFTMRSSSTTKHLNNIQITQKHLQHRNKLQIYYMQIQFTNRKYALLKMINGTNAISFQTSFDWFVDCCLTQQYFSCTREEHKLTHNTVLL